MNLEFIIEESALAMLTGILTGYTLESNHNKNKTYSEYLSSTFKNSSSPQIRSLKDDLFHLAAKNAAITSKDKRNILLFTPIFLGTTTAYANYLMNIQPEFYITFPVVQAAAFMGEFIGVFAGKFFANKKELKKKDKEKLIELTNNLRKKIIKGLPSEMNSEHALYTLCDYLSLKYSSRKANEQLLEMETTRNKLSAINGLLSNDTAVENSLIIKHYVHDFNKPFMLIFSHNDKIYSYKFPLQNTVNPYISNILEPEGVVLESEKYTREGVFTIMEEESTYQNLIYVQADDAFDVGEKISHSLQFKQELIKQHVLRNLK